MLQASVPHGQHCPRPLTEQFWTKYCWLKMFAWLYQTQLYQYDQVLHWYYIGIVSCCVLIGMFVYACEFGVFGNVWRCNSVSEQIVYACELSKCGEVISPLIENIVVSVGIRITYLFLCVCWLKRWTENIHLFEGHINEYSFDTMFFFYFFRLRALQVGALTLFFRVMIRAHDRPHRTFDIPHT